MKLEQVIEAILEDPGALYVRKIPGGHKIKPEELWLPSIHTWVRTDGTFYNNGSLHDGYCYPGWLGRIRIRLAVRKRNNDWRPL